MQTPEQRDPYGAALGVMRHLTEAGRFVPGEAIVVTDLAAEVGFSPTPLREALACLAGEGLIERRRGRGYFYPALTAAEVIDSFEVELAYLHAALTLYPRGLTPLRKAVASLGPLDDVQSVFRAIIAQSGNATLTLAHQRLCHRLGAVLRAERARTDAPFERSRAMVAAVLEGRIAHLLELLQMHHDWRCTRAPALLAPHEP